MVEISPRVGHEPGMAGSVGQRLTHCATGAPSDIQNQFHSSGVGPSKETYRYFVADL